VSVATFLKTAYLTHFSKPASDRLVYQVIRRQRVRSILEFGIGEAQRALRMIEMARLASPGEEIQYTGIDLFEGRSTADGPGVSLKMAHRILSATEAKVRLIPGDPANALARMANTLGHADLVVISAWRDTASLAKAWYYLPRILHPASEVLLEDCQSGGCPKLRGLTLSEIATLASAAAVRRVA
jgi:hypothetical protein